MTNGDVVRKMTDEELCAMFLLIGEGNTPVKMVCSKQIPDQYLEHVWLSWLKQEVQDA